MTAACLTVTSDVQTLLPGVLIDYIWNLALGEKCRYCNNQFFTLKQGELSGGNVQDIHHIYDLPRYAERRRVFGLDPVNCKLRIKASGGNYQMMLGGI